MQKYVCLLRGINVGGNNKVDMKTLKVVFENMGFTNVSTYINSGNVIFDSDIKDNYLLSDKIENELENHFKFKINVLVISSENIKHICNKTPTDWQDNTEARTYVLFLWDKFNNKDTVRILGDNPKVDTVIYTNGAIIWNVGKSNYMQSGMKKLLGTELYKNMTVRNINTVRKLNELCYGIKTKA